MRKIEDKEMPFLEHLEELRQRILICLGVIVILSVVGFFISPYVLDWITKPLIFAKPDSKLYFFGVAGGFVVRFKLAIIIGIVISLPLIFYEIWMFIVPALTGKERSYVLPAVFSTTTLFVSGVIFAYYLIVPRGIKILLMFSSGRIEPLLEVDGYLNFILWFLVACGLIFELPVIIFFLVKVGIVSPTFLRGKRREAWVIAFFIAALTPTQDMVSMIIQVFVLIILYEIGIWLSYFAVRKKKEKLTIAVEKAG